MSHRPSALALGLLAGAAALGAVTSPAAAQQGVLEVPIDTIVREEQGSVIELASVEVPEDAIGLLCTGVVTTANQESVHPGNDLIVETGDSSVRFEDVEDIPGRTITGSGSFVLGGTFTVFLVMGPEQIFSGGLVVVVECEAPITTTTTTTTEPTTTTESTTTTTEPTTTTAAPTTTTTTTTTTTIAPTTSGGGAIANTSTTTTPTSTTSAPQIEGELPATGSGDIIPGLLIGTALLGGGIALVSWERRHGHI